ncbi:hypothetical protein [Pseudomonas chlororaphis]|uniref:hypothetical protein n=1 Tax=Pseudomonas chlororaphis TaxID=587753 RepID=UPI000F570AE0|nr:hypothetical protein [Pseudomonas chlororaphis]MBP5056447.1 hypothetical protein [Pseudomonas chlororaphis]MBP5070632.1 hypothetical protein [Pseudomonas chlororaphis]MBP5087856.1 hypothetical protein [Pseudomonas chlororaphis]MBP5141963.1 hypothetical protein [Pseudomonas chlororaphis]QTT81958.1 hypothetical protein HUT29_11870 [Pseudomonas chlororaphis]
MSTSLCGLNIPLDAGGNTPLIDASRLAKLPVWIFGNGSPAMTSIGCGTRHLLFRFNVNFQTESFPKLQQHTSLEFKGCLSALAIAVPKSRLPANKVPKGGKMTLRRHFSFSQGAPLPVDAETFYLEGRLNGFAQHWRERKKCRNCRGRFFCPDTGIFGKAAVIALHKARFDAACREKEQRTISGPENAPTANETPNSANYWRNFRFSPALVCKSVGQD